MFLVEPTCPAITENIGYSFKVLLNIIFEKMRGSFTKALTYNIKRIGLSTVGGVIHDRKPFCPVRLIASLHMEN